jgi:hypothetical protein
LRECVTTRHAFLVAQSGEFQLHDSAPYSVPARELNHKSRDRLSDTGRGG